MVQLMLVSSMQCAMIQHLIRFIVHMNNGYKIWVDHLFRSSFSIDYYFCCIFKVFRLTLIQVLTTTVVHWRQKCTFLAPKSSLFFYTVHNVEVTVTLHMYKMHIFKLYWLKAVILYLFMVLLFKYDTYPIHLIIWWIQNSSILSYFSPLTLI